MYFDGLVISKEVFSESIHCTETHLDVVVEIIELHNIVSFYFCINEELI